MCREFTVKWIDMADEQICSHKSKQATVTAQIKYTWSIEGIGRVSWRILKSESDFIRWKGWEKSFHARVIAEMGRGSICHFGGKAKCCMCPECRVLAAFLEGEPENIDWDCTQ